MPVHLLIRLLLLRVNVDMVKDEACLRFLLYCWPSSLACAFSFSVGPYTWFLGKWNNLGIYNILCGLQEKSAGQNLSSYCLIALTKENLFSLGVGVTMEKAWESLFLLKLISQNEPSDWVYFLQPFFLGIIYLLDLWFEQMWCFNFINLSEERCQDALIAFFFESDFIFSS